MLHSRISCQLQRLYRRLLLVNRCNLYEEEEYLKTIHNDPKHFYVTLFSNASQTLQSGNMIGSFTVNLAQPIDLGSTEK